MMDCASCAMSAQVITSVSAERSGQDRKEEAAVDYEMEDENHQHPSTGLSYRTMRCSYTDAAL
jgi:hypothetical protein